MRCERRTSLHAFLVELDDDCGSIENVRRLVTEARRDGLLGGDEDESED